LTDSGPVVGIDLGTTNSCVSVMIDGQVHVIPDESGERLQASVVAFLEDGSVVVGNSAREESMVDPANTVSSAKRLIGRAFDSEVCVLARQQFAYAVVEGKERAPVIEVRGKRYSVPEISGMGLRRLKDIAEAYLGCPVRQAVITVPANFNDGQRQMTKLAGELAGLEVLRVLNEPTAAALAYGYGREIEAKLAIYDFGGGTFDITLLDVRGSVFEVMGTAGDTYLGGDDFDYRLARYMFLAFSKTHGFSIEEDPVARSRLKLVAERTKIELSERERVIVDVQELACDPHGRSYDLKFQIERESLGRFCGDIVERSFEVCDAALAEAGLSKGDLDGVVLVGGMTQIPLIQELVGEHFGQAPMTDLHPDEVVSVGAAIQGAALVADVFTQQVPGGQPLLLDVTPMSLGVKTAGGLFDVLIRRNAPIPCEHTRTFSTAADFQSVVRLEVYQGENRLAVDNVKLGEVELYGLASALRGEVSVDVTFELDTDGIVVVTARNPQTGQVQAARLTLAAGYSPEELKRMRARSGIN
jgi:molecular chaperone DnaK